MAVVKNAPHPNATRLFLDFVLSEEGAKLMVKQGWLPTRKGVDMGRLAEVGKVESLIITDPTIGKETSDNEKAFREIFGKA